MTLEVLRIQGPGKLSGEISVHGAKNSTLPVLAASLLCISEAVVHNCPLLSDVDTAVRILRYTMRDETCILRYAGYFFAMDNKENRDG